MAQSTNPRIPTDHALIGRAAGIPINVATPYVSMSPIVLPAPNRALDIQMKISAPVTGEKLPIILLSHGQGHSNHLSSLNGYGPMVNFWASHGFVVIQPTHLSSKSVSVDSNTPGAPMFFKQRPRDMTYILDHLDDLEMAFPFIKGRLDKEKIAIAGHSAGGHTSNMLLGMRITDSDSGGLLDLHDSRIKAGLLLAGTGNGDVTDWVKENYRDLASADFEKMTTPALVVIGDQDASAHLTPRGPSWHADPYNLSPSPKNLLTLFGGHHGLGGISGFDTAEASEEENVEQVATVQRMTWAYLRSILYPGDKAWESACAALQSIGTLGSTESK